MRTQLDGCELQLKACRLELNDWDVVQTHCDAVLTPFNACPDDEKPFRQARNLVDHLLEPSWMRLDDAADLDHAVR